MKEYQDHLLAEGIRLIEKTPSPDMFSTAQDTRSFQAQVIKRAKIAELRYQVMPVFHHIKRLMTVFIGCMCLCFFIIGLGSIAPLSSHQDYAQINIFWAILLLIIPNLLSLLMWLLLFTRSNLVKVSWISHFSLSLMAMLDKLHHKVVPQHGHYATLFRYYVEHRFRGEMGRAQLSFMSHIWWTSYTLGATLYLLLVLATHQVDFIWQTTILNETTFVWLTQLLTALPDLIGIAVPNPSDVMQVNIGAINSSDVAQYQRLHWSNLLLFSLVVYALIPRAILAWGFAWRVKQLQKRFRININLPYYVQLNSLLSTSTQKHFIKDQDTLSSKVTSPDIMMLLDNKQMLPANAVGIAVELSDRYLQFAQKMLDNFQGSGLSNIIDRASEQQALQTLYTAEKQPLILFVDAKRLPDRGWLTLVKKCRYRDDLNITLVLLVSDKQDLQSSVRLQDWLAIATQAKIQPQHRQCWVVGETRLFDHMDQEPQANDG